MISGIYAILNITTGKFYLGSSKNIYKRWHSHKSALNGKYHDNSYLQNAWNKYGELDFILVILQLTSQLNLENIEQLWIDKTKCYDKTIGYNSRIKANNNFGFKHSELGKLNISNSKKGKSLSLEHRAKLKISQKKRPPISEETRLKLSLIKLNQSDETKRKISESKKGIPRSEATKAKLKAAWVIRKQNRNSII
ncbi:MAG: GIY-YIG nuclease family protein [Patescibacteria group bacterium]|nr:GIY-YIG nuclease family protein [Patescibacteria group bacterium]